jgi:hypothetical protein
MSDLDTRNKRGSGIGIDSPMLRVWPNPDGTIGQADRQQTAFKYEGILASAPAGGGKPWIYYAMQQNQAGR